MNHATKIPDAQTLAQLEKAKTWRSVTTSFTDNMTG